MEAWNELKIAVPFPRLTLGLIFLVSGVSKAANGLGAISEWMTKAFADTFLPEIAVRLFAYTLVPLELLLGLLLLLGLWRRTSLMVTLGLLYLLLFGKLLLGDHPVVFQNAFYILLASIGLAVVPFDPCGIDAVRKR